MNTNLHHEFWEARHWKSYSIASQIREHHLSKIVMAVPIHNELHRFVEPVEPPRTPQIGRSVLQLLNEYPMTYTPLDAAKALRDDLYDTDAEYLSDHMNNQIPFLELSMRVLKQRRL